MTKPLYPASNKHRGITRGASTEWMRRGACVGSEPMAFFLPSSFGAKATAATKRICAGCPVREQCLDFAITENMQEGIWGGLTVRERGRIRRMRQQEARDKGSTNGRTS